MADYYPLISRALDGLSDKSPDMRRAVYDRARTALMAQLESLDPPLPFAEITRERLALDDAIDRIEAEHSLKEAVLAPPPSPSRPREPTPPPARAPEPARDPLPEAAPPSHRMRPEPAREPIPEQTFDDMLDEVPPPVRERPRVDTVSRITADQGRARAMILAGVLAVV